MKHKHRSHITHADTATVDMKDNKAVRVVSACDVCGCRVVHNFLFILFIIVSLSGYSNGLEPTVLVRSILLTAVR